MMKGRGPLVQRLKRELEEKFRKEVHENEERIIEVQEFNRAFEGLLSDSRVIRESKEEEKSRGLLFSLVNNITQNDIRRYIKNVPILIVPDTDLVIALKNNETVTARNIIREQGIQCRPGAVTAGRYTALVIAILKKNLIIANMLIDTFGEYCNPSIPTMGENTALLLSITYLPEITHKLITKFNIECNPSIPNNNGITALSNSLIDTPYYDITEHLIDKFGILCNAEHASQAGNTAFMACLKSSDDNPIIDSIALKMINTFDLLCNVQYVRQPEQETAFIYACYYRSEEVILKMIEQFGDLCIPQIMTINKASAFAGCFLKKHTNAIYKMIDVFGINCLPGSTSTSGQTPLMMAVSESGESTDFREIVKLLISKFGTDCKPEYVSDKTSTTALINACIAAPDDIVELLINTFDLLCNPSHVISESSEFGNTIFSGFTAFLVLCGFNRVNLALLMLEKFGELCQIRHKATDGRSAMGYIKHYPEYAVLKEYIKTHNL